MSARAWAVWRTGLLGLVLVSTGCRPPGQGAETVLALHTLAGGLGSVTTQAGVSLVGTLVGTRGMTMVRARGGPMTNSQPKRMLT
jgi:hypothetical protein